MPVSPNKLGLASGLANLATEGDFGRETLEEMASTLAAALRAQPAPANQGEPSSPRAQLAQRVRYEHVCATSDAPRFAAAVAQLEADDRLRQQVDFTL